MNLNPEYLARIYLTVFILVIGSLVYGVYQQVLFVKKQRKDFLQNFEEDYNNSTYTEYLDMQFRNKVQDIQQIIQIKEKIKQINMGQKVYNTELGPICNTTQFVVIQVHSNAFYIRELLVSLSVANGIQDALLIFSHDYFSYEINALIQEITFAKYMQIFYPYSIQLHPKVFPGNDSQFCTDGYVCKESNLRDPQAAQMKHHWWWAVNQVFDNMEVTESFNNTILFIEEGDYVTPDFLFVHRLLRKARFHHCPFCELLSMGAHKPSLNQYKKATVTTIEVWTSKTPRTGIAFNRKLWNDLKGNSDVFCYHNDFNWDSSLRYVAEQKWEGNIYMTAIAGRRVFRLKQCDKYKCIGLDVTVVQSFVEQISKYLYPWSMMMVVRNEEDFDEESAGLWGDIRDRELCMHFTKNNVWF